MRSCALAVAIVFLINPAMAAPLTEAGAIEIAKTYCTKQIPKGERWKWTASLYREVWAVRASPEGDLWSGLMFSIPPNGPVPKRCVRFKFE